MPSGRQFLRDALKDFVFSLSQGAEAAAKVPGPRGNTASFAASVAAPGLRRDIELQKVRDEQDRQLKINQIKDAIQRGQFQDSVQRLNILKDIPTQEQTFNAGLPNAAGMPSFGPTTISAPQRPIEIPGLGMVSPSTPQDRAKAEIERYRQQQQIQTDENIRQTNATYHPPVDQTPNFVNIPPIPGILPNGMQGVPSTIAPSIIGALTPSKSASEDELVPDKVNVDGAGTQVLRNKRGEFFDANTRKPIMGRITPYIAPPSPRQKGEITPTAEAGLIQNLNKQWEQASKDVQQLYRANSIMDAGMTAARRGDLNSGSQAVIVTFQKFLDPTSVVRESEYARSAQGLAMAERIRGFYDRLAQGGAGVTLAELEKFATLAKEINQKLSAEGTSLLSAERKRISAVSDRYGIPQELVIPKFDFAQPTPTQPSAAPKGGFKVKR